MNRRFRFKIKGEWSGWYTDQDDLSFLRDNKNIQAMETVEEMPREQAEIGGPCPSCNCNHCDGRGYVPEGDAIEACQWCDETGKMAIEPARLLTLIEYGKRRQKSYLTK